MLRVTSTPIAESSDEKAISATLPFLPTDEESFKQFVDEKELQSEDHFGTLARAAVDHILAYSQPLVTNKGLKVRKEETKQVTAGNVKVNAIDDGGIRSRKHVNEIHSFVALFEVKKRLHTARGDAEVSDEDLAQMAYAATVPKKNLRNTGWLTL